MTPLEAALRYTANGWRVVPVLPGQKRPALSRWTDAATADQDTVRVWWEVEHPDAGVGIVTGPGSGLWVLDVDDHDSLHDLEQRHEKLPPTLTSITGSGGLHLFFRWPAGAEVRNDAGRRLGPGLDVRGEGGFVVAAPTVHPNGSEYAWDLGEPDEPVDAPQWLVDLVTHEEQRPERPARLKLARSDRPGDQWAAATPWSDLLTADGWTLHHVDRDGEAHWVRPGKDPRDGTSATTNYQGSDVLKVFTSNPPAGLVEGETYTKLGYLAATRWSGDHSAAARFLASQGWGTVEADDVSQWINMGASAVRDGENAERSTVGTLVARTIEAAPVPDTGTETGAGWEFVDLGAILDGSYDPPVPTMGLRTDGVGLLYPGRVHSFSGEPGGGKTWLGLHHIAEVLAGGGSAGMIDYEDTPAAIVARLVALGVDLVAIRERFHYVSPDGPVERDTVERLVALNLDHWLVDSVGEALAVEGFSPNADDEVAQWYRRLPRPLAAGGACVELLDHVAKDRETRGSWAIGSQRKLAAIDGAAYVVDVINAPTKEDDGQLRIRCAKDRHGTHQRGHVVAEVLVLNADDGGVSVVVRRQSTNHRPTGLMENLSRWMEDKALDAPFTKNDLTSAPVGKLVEKDGEQVRQKAKADHVRAAVTVLVAEGFVTIEYGASNAHLHTLVKPYRQADDPKSDVSAEGVAGQYEALQKLAAGGGQPVDNHERVPASRARPEQGDALPETERVPASPAYEIAGTRDAVGTVVEVTESEPARPDPDDDDLGEYEEGDW